MDPYTLTRGGGSLLLKLSLHSSSPSIGFVTVLVKEGQSMRQELFRLGKRRASVFLGLCEQVELSWHFPEQTALVYALPPLPKNQPVFPHFAQSWLCSGA